MNDIEILEKLVIYWNSLINYAETDKKGVVYKWINTEGIVEKRNALQNLINRIKELEEIEKEHQKQNGELQEKIEELEKEQKECILYKHTLECDECMERCGIFPKIQVLQELLEE